jgi:hypothetical protein
VHSGLFGSVARYDTYGLEGTASEIVVCGRMTRPHEDQVGTLLPDRIESSIYLIRDEKVMLDHDLASLYGVPTKALLQAVKRNRERFPR